MRYSRQREIILQTVQETDSHPSADWVYDQVRRNMPSISLGTVYRNLNQLADLGQLRRIHEGSLVRYDGNLARHDHLHCTSCARIIDANLTDENFSTTLPQVPDFQVTGYSLDLQGLCGDCQNNPKEMR